MPHEDHRPLPDLRNLGDLPGTSLPDNPVSPLSDLRPGGDPGDAAHRSGPGLALLLIAWVVLAIALLWVFFVEARGGL